MLVCSLRDIPVWPISHRCRTVRSGGFETPKKMKNMEMRSGLFTQYAKPNSTYFYYKYVRSICKEKRTYILKIAKYSNWLRMVLE